MSSFLQKISSVPLSVQGGLQVPRTGGLCGCSQGMRGGVLILEDISGALIPFHFFSHLLVKRFFSLLPHQEPRSVSCIRRSRLYFSPFSWTQCDRAFEKGKLILQPYMHFRSFFSDLRSNVSLNICFCLWMSLKRKKWLTRYHWQTKGSTQTSPKMCYFDTWITLRWRQPRPWRLNRNFYLSVKEFKCGVLP